MHGANVTHNMENYLKAPIDLMNKLYQENTDEIRLEIIRKRLIDMYYNLGCFYFQLGIMYLCRKNMIISLMRGGNFFLTSKYIILSLIPRFMNSELKRIVGLLNR